MRTATSYNLNGKQLFSLQVKVSNLPEGSTESWVEMAYTSKWEGHSAGSFEFTEQALNDIVTNFNASPELLPVYFGHPNHELGLPMPAAGWVRALQVKPSDKGLSLWGRVEWTQDTAASIKKGEYRYCSVVVDFAPVDRKTGDSAGAAKMYELGLVGSPFLPGMQSISLSQIETNQRKLAMKKTDKVVKAPAEDPKAVDAICPDCGKSPCECKDKAMAEAPADASIPEAEAAVVEEVEPVDAATEEDNMAAEKELGNVLTTATGLDLGSLLLAVNQNLEAVAATIMNSKETDSSNSESAAATVEADPAPKKLEDSVSLAAHVERALALAEEVKLLQAQVVELSAYKNAALEVETKARVEAKFSALVAEGKVTLSQKPTFLKACSANEAAALEIYNSLPVVKPPQGSLVTGLSASPVKAPGVVSGGSLDDNDPIVHNLRLSARGQGLKGVHVDEFVRRALINKAKFE